MMIRVFFVACLLSLAAGAAKAQCTQAGGYPWTPQACINTTDLNRAFEMSRGNTPPTNAANQGVGFGKLWLDTSTTPNHIRQCIVQSPELCSPLYDPAQWTDWGAIDGNTLDFPIGGGTITVTSGTTVDLGLYPQASITISGNASISSFGSSLPAGRAKFLIIAGNPTIVYGNTRIVTSTGANLTPVPGDVVVAISDGNGLWHVLYTAPAGAINPFTGDSGSGGVEGLVPAPGAGDAAAGKVLGASGGWVAQSGGPTLIVATNTALTNLATSGMVSGTSTVRRAGSTVPGDGGDGYYTYSSSACSLNSGAGDNGSQVRAQGGGCWRLSAASQVDARVFGAKVDGTTDDSAAMNAALAACRSAGGGQVTIPGTGHAMALHTQVSIPSGCIVRGFGHLNWNSSQPFFDNIETDWTAAGSWIKCTFTDGLPCLRVAGNGPGIEGIKFWQDQPTPTVTTGCAAPCTYTHGWTPNTTPFTVKVDTSSNFARLRDLVFVNSTNCIDWEGPSSGISGIGVSAENLWLGCFGTGQKFHLVDNVVTENDVHHQILWYLGSSDLYGWMENPANHASMDICYLANPMFSNIEFAFDGLNLKLTNCSVSSGFGTVTFALNGAQLSTVSFNESCQALGLASHSTVFTGSIRGIVAYANSVTSPVAGQCARATPNFFDLGSGQVNASLGDIQGGLLQSLTAVGYSGGGALRLDNVDIVQYSAFASGAPAFGLAAGASLTFGGGPVRSIRPGTGAGGLTGPGEDSTSGVMELLQAVVATPATSSSFCEPGQIAMDATYIYTCPSLSSWHRASNGASW